MDQRQQLEREGSNSHLANGRRRPSSSSVAAAEEATGTAPASSLVSPTNSFDATTSTTAADSSSRPAAVPIVDLSDFQNSWANTNGEDVFGGGAGGCASSVFGGSMTVASSSTSGFDSRMSFSSTSLLTFSTAGNSTLVDRPLPLSRRISSAPRVDASSMIHDSARITDWDRVLELCRTNPEYAKYTGADGWTALHHACNRRCPRPEVAEALINAYPDALMTEEEKGWLPLHYACRFKAPKEVVSLLLHMHPEKGRVGVSKKDRLGRTPLYYAVRYDAPPGVVGVLLLVNPAAVLEEDQHDDSPLALVWTQWAEKLEAKRIIHSFLPPHPEGTSEQERAEFLRRRMRKQPKLLKRWNKVNMLLKAAFGFPVEDEDEDAEEGSEALGTERKWRIVHATAAVKCHLSLFLLACALHPEQARELDESDLQRPGDPIRTSGGSTNQTALHLAASSNATGEMGKSVVHRLLGLNRDAAQVQDSIDGSLPLHRMVENKLKQDWPEHAAVLYHVYPRAVQVADFNGKLPLHRAAAAITHIDRDGEDNYFETSVIVNVVRNSPQAASHADNARCLPLHWIAMNAHLWDAQVEAVYNAHRAAAQARAGPEMENRLALHMAAASDCARGSLLSKLVALHPRGASMQDRQGKLPLHLACEIGKEWNDGLLDVYESFPEAIQQPEDNERHWYALHMAVNNPKSSPALIHTLIDLFPGAAAVPDGKGRFPLHLACSAGRSWNDCLGLLFEACPAALSTVDETGMVPFHIAALQYCYPESAEDEVAAAPTFPQTGIPEESTDEKDSAELDILFQLLRADPTVLA